MKTAKINDRIRSKKGIVGIVEKVYENSVMIKIALNRTGVLYENNVTVINHKNYQILKQVTI
ncbi:DUF2187 family protein [Neobacillus mesonae]|uniref:DUF2187 family protein n=1 Tax=Neobacillus mesonae TaxID=1193713 RepID=UPI00203DE9B8|nr:DUF2187 family protein [Neobacillus mesonae]MCM3570630.1 YkvS family protein [Neobacillus mesonae]